MRLVGKHTHQLDDRNRFRVPVKFKSFFDGNKKSLYICPGRNLKCLYIVDEDRFDQMCAELETSILDGSEQAELKAFILSNSQQVSVDKQGRVAVDQTLLDCVNIGKNIVTIGVGSYLEMWPEDTRDRIDKGIGVNFSELLKKLENLGNSGF